MKITNAVLKLAEIPLKEPFHSVWNPGNPETKLYVSLVEILTEDGIKGYGAACDSTQLLAWIWDSHVKLLLIGKEITQIEEISAGLNNMTLYAYRPWSIEVAVWDALGKYTGLPVYKLLGGAQDRILAYASTGELKKVEERIEDAERFISEGFKIMKVRAHHNDVKKDLKEIEKLVNAVGDRIDIAVDANQGWFFTGKKAVKKWDFKTVLYVAEFLEDIGVVWLEEPLHRYDFKGNAELRKRVGINIAGGELNNKIEEYRELLKHDCFDIYQMDTVLSGGILQSKKVASMVEAENKIFTPHTWTHGMGLAAALHVAGSTFNCPFIEYCYDPPRWDYTVRDCMLTEPLKIDKEGYIHVPSGPGLGVELNHELIDKYSVISKK
jgi:L-alanine-DL-glutamate epimerase-like enolase superfamily enzyme